METGARGMGEATFIWCGGGNGHTIKDGGWAVGPAGMGSAGKI